MIPLFTLLGEVLILILFVPLAVILCGLKPKEEAAGGIYIE